MIFDRESEALLKQNITMYKTQMEELEMQVLDLKTQLNGARERESILKRESISGQDAVKQRELSYKQENENLKRVILPLLNVVELSKELHSLKRYLETSQVKEDLFPRDTYVKKLEMNIKFLNSQTKELIEEKSNLQIANETLENELKNLSDKLYRDIEEKYKKEIEEKNFIIKSLKRDFEAYMQMDGETEHRSVLRKTVKKKLNKIVNQTEASELILIEHEHRIQ